MNRIFVALLAALLLTPAANAATITVGDSTASWETFMDVFELDGTTYAFGSGWGVADAVTTFDDGAGTMTLSPNTINDTNEYWYQNTSGTATPPNVGGPGQLGNKIMQASTFIGDDSLSGSSVTFEGTVLSNTYTSAHEATIFIRDFAADYSSFVDVTAPATVGAFSITLATDPTPGRHVQYGFQSRGENVWVTDVAPFGSVVIGTVAAVPEPASAMMLLSMAAAIVVTRRRM